MFGSSELMCAKLYSRFKGQHYFPGPLLGNGYPVSCGGPLDAKSVIPMESIFSLAATQTTATDTSIP
jgi:hypothetical protein